MRTRHALSRAVDRPAYRRWYSHDLRQPSPKSLDTAPRRTTKRRRARRAPGLTLTPQRRPLRLGLLASLVGTERLATRVEVRVDVPVRADVRADVRVDVGAGTEVGAGADVRVDLRVAGADSVGSTAAEDAEDAEDDEEVAEEGLDDEGLDGAGVP
mmetsp:Transcript_20208/g.52830  ORF Transcript_20208/g.52830 Transcript_20208/m.52830 type:complete len:156 (-) Transcript_20208:214-681(-)